MRICLRKQILIPALATCQFIQASIIKVLELRYNYKVLLCDEELWQ